MTVVIVEGPEKVGKTTTASLAVDMLKSLHFSASRVHWGPVEPDDRQFSGLLRMHSTDPYHIYVWDRGWPSEHVYSRLLGRGRRLDNAWLGEWLHGRAVSPSCRFIFTAETQELINRRDETDLPVDPQAEKDMYEEYARRFDWIYLRTDYTLETTYANAKQIAVNAAYDFERRRVLGYFPTHWAGLIYAETVVAIGQKKNERYIPGGWMPFSTDSTIQLGREFDDKALEFAWMDANEFDPKWLRGRKNIIACGKIAQERIAKTIKEQAYDKINVVNIPHPSFMYLYQMDTSATADNFSDVRLMLHNLINK